MSKEREDGGGDSERRRLERATTTGAGHGGEGWGQRGGTDSVCLCAPRWGARAGVVGEGGMGAGLPGTGDPLDISLPERGWFWEPARAGMRVRI